MSPAEMAKKVMMMLRKVHQMNNKKGGKLSLFEMFNVKPKVS